MKTKTNSAFDNPHIIFYHNKDIVHFYRTLKLRSNKWQSVYRWKRVSPNGKIVGASTKSYKTLRNCKANYDRQFILPKRVEGL